MINSRANLNLCAVSAGVAETEIDTPANMDQSIVLDIGDYLNLDVRRESNAGEANGKEEPDVIYDNGATVSGAFNFNKLQPNHAAFLLAFGLGAVETVAEGSGYRHNITPIRGDLDMARSNPSFTAMQRWGDTINKRRFLSCFVDSLSLSFSADDWVKGVGNIKGTGNYTDTVIEVEVSALDNATTLTLPTAVPGSTADDRLSAVQLVRVPYDTTEDVFVTVTDVSSVDPAVLTIVPPPAGIGEPVTYKILYQQPEPAWAAFPSRIIESPMRVSEMCLMIGGSWNPASGAVPPYNPIGWEGGTPIGPTLQSCEYNLNNNMAVEFTPCAGGDYAGRCSRDGRVQTIKLNREMRNMLLQQYMGANEYFGLQILCEGAEFDTGHRYTLELVFPKLGLLATPLNTSKKRVSEAGDLMVLEHDIHGSVIAIVKNEVSGYAI